MRIGVGGAAPIVLSIVIFSGCSLFSPVKIETKRHELDAFPLDLPSEKTRPATILVLAPAASPLLASTQMAYSTHVYETAYFSRNEWAETPSQMIQPLIVKTLRSTRFFSDVSSPPDLGRHTFVLRTEILELTQDFISEPAAVKLTMRISLSRETPAQLVAAIELSEREPMREKNPDAGVAAANEALSKLLGELARFVVAKAD
jgi:cholesterol transport system auxiliary component